LFVTLASVVAGLTVSTVRWLVVDTLHHRTGLPPPPRDFSRLGGNEAAFGLIVEDHYRYYQFYSNMLVALFFTLILRHAAAGGQWSRFDGIDAIVFATGGTFFAGSRDTLRKYYERTGQLLRIAEKSRRGLQSAHSARINS
jgi:hypothetical protein